METSDRGPIEVPDVEEAVEVWAAMRRGPDGSWVARTITEPAVEVTGADRRACLDALRREVRVHTRGTPLDLVVEVIAPVAGVAEAAALMGWDKRRVITYVTRGSFPEPLQALASGRVWSREDVERYAREWHERRARRLDSRDGTGR